MSQHLNRNKKFLMNCQRKLERSMAKRSMCNFLELGSHSLPIDTVVAEVTPEVRSAKLEVYTEGEDVVVIGFPLKSLGAVARPNIEKTVDYNAKDFMERHFPDRKTSWKQVADTRKTPLHDEIEKYIYSLSRGWVDKFKKAELLKSQFLGFRRRDCLPIAIFDFEDGTYQFWDSSILVRENIESFDDETLNATEKLGAIPWSIINLQYEDSTGRVHEYPLDRGF